MKLLPKFFTQPARRLIANLLIACVTLSVIATPAYSQSKGEVKVYIAQSESAKMVLRNLLSMFGRKLVADGLTSAPVSGRFEARSVEDVMGYFQSAYQINWFQNGTTVYAYNVSDWGTRRVYVGGERSNEDWKELLKSAGLDYKEFNIVYNTDSKELIVAGPREYLKLVEGAFKQDRPDPSEQDKHGVQLMEFPLKHASVEDRQVKLRENTVLTPGALTVLLNLLGLPAQNGLNLTPGTGGSKGMGTIGYARQNAESTSSGYVLASKLGAEGVGKTQAQSEGDAKKDPLKESAVSVTADPRTNSILIRDAKSKYNYYKELIDQLDKPVAMIEVEAMMVEVSEKALNELGMEFGLLSRTLAYDFPGQSVGRESPLFAPGSSSIVNPRTFLARLRALAADENAKVLARPSILTQDNVSAYIDLSQTLYLQVAGERVADVVPVTAGSLLQVTPRVVFQDAEERIFLRIEIQDGSLSNDISGIQTPRIQNTSLSTQAVIQREKAILIGGYNRQSTDTKEYKVPLLGSIPVIGKAFSVSEKKTETVARLFLITPRLVEGPGHESNSTKNALDKMQMSFKLKPSAPVDLPTLKLDTRISR